jgi:hypothetical protein
MHITSKTSRRHADMRGSLKAGKLGLRALGHFSAV